MGADRTKNPMHPGEPPVGNSLKNGVTGGDPRKAPRCGAKTRSGTPCKGPAVRGRARCRLHGGKSTGPRSREGVERIRAARTVHGGRSAEMRELFAQLRRTRLEAEALVAQYIARQPKRAEPSANTENGASNNV